MAATTGSFKPEIWSGKFTENFVESTSLTQIANTNYEGSISGKGSKVIIHQAPVVTSSAYTDGAAITYQDITGENVELLIDHSQYFAFHITDINKAQSDPKLVNEATSAAADAQRIAIEKHVYGTVLADMPAAVLLTNSGAAAGAKSGNINLGTLAAPVALTKTNVIEYLLNIGLVLDEQNIPEQGRNLLIPARMAALIKASDLKDASITGDATSVLRNGRLGMIDRFTLYTSNNLLAAQGAGVAWDVIACTKQALTFATQLSEVQYLDKMETTFKKGVRGLQLYGFKLENPKAMAYGRVSF